MSGDHIESDGIVKDSCKGILTVELVSGQFVKAQLSGKMRQNKINIIVGDKVRVKMSPYDMSKGIIYKREGKKSYHDQSNQS